MAQQSAITGTSPGPDHVVTPANLSVSEDEKRDESWL
jgi:hypothetical protein